MTDWVNIKLCIHICNTFSLVLLNTTAPFVVSVETTQSQHQTACLRSCKPVDPIPKYNKHVKDVLYCSQHHFNIHIGYRCSSVLSFTPDLSRSVCVNKLEGVLFGFNLFSICDCASYHMNLNVFLKCCK